ncbi:hypothetical protein PSTG_00501 [Puccinia striiformis f. sp. tritici PST-78]|uniref:Uncharacterized protein n=1 Tax=Puccinia striiformis f. sp. tritici PST-78 TaxID=1165861 RepID=A0A0L0W585_9BASI|nr:hypothetical protein PSTG_00501 [Puccinia striiformis f. sp. tritici PST-78]
MQVQYNLLEMRNTSAHVDVNAQLLVQDGTVFKTYELVYGKYAVITQDMVGSMTNPLFKRLHC